MTVKITLDAGHAGKRTDGSYATAGKRTPNGIPEWNFNDKILRACEAYLKGYEGVQIQRVDDPTGRTDVSLYNRVKKSNDWGADAYISFHNNALKGVWGNHSGAESFIANNSSAGELQKVLHAEMLKETKNPNRGTKKSDFYVLKHTKMKAVLLEFFFMDSKEDYKKLTNDSVLKRVGEGVAKGLVSFYKLKPKAKPAPVKTSAPSKKTQIRVKVDSLNFYDSPRWTNPTGNVRKGTILTIDSKINVEGHPQYKTISGTYFSANSKYVETI